MVDQHVALAQHGEELRRVVRRLGQAGRRHGGPRLAVQVGAVQGVDAPEPAQVEGGADTEHAVGPHLELGGQQVDEVLAGVGLDLEPERLAEAPAAQLHLDGDQEVVRLVLLEGEVGVAGDPEGVVVADGHPREERVQVGRDHLLERHEALAVGHHHEAGQRRRHLHPGDAPLPRCRVLHLDHQVEGQVRDVREGVAGVDGQRGQHGVDLTLEDLDEVPTVIVVEGGPAGEADARLGQPGHDAVQEDMVLAPDQLLDPAPDHGQLLARPQPVDRAGAHAGGHLVLQRGHPYLVELVEQLGEDGEELGPLQQRDAVVLGQVEQAGAEVEARLLTVGEALVPEGLDLLVRGRSGMLGLDLAPDLLRRRRRCPL